MDFGTAEISFVIISGNFAFVKKNLWIFSGNFGNPFYEVIFLDFTKKAAAFCLGGGAYVGLELLWRGRSHGSMFAAGGLSLLLAGRQRYARGTLGVRMLRGAAIITGIELVTGLLVNRRHTVWDYRDQPGNFLGQICPGYCLLWIPLAGVAMGIYGVLFPDTRQNSCHCVAPQGPWQSPDNSGDCHASVPAGSQ